MRTQTFFNFATAFLMVDMIRNKTTAAVNRYKQKAMEDALSNLPIRNNEN